MDCRNLLVASVAALAVTGFGAGLVGAQEVREFSLG